MFRGTTARSVPASCAVALLALLYFTPAETFTSAHTLSEAKATVEARTPCSPQPVRKGADMVRSSPSPSGCAQEHPLIAGRAAGADTPGTPGAVDRCAPRPSRAHTPAALEVFRC
ncbi:hypothetical protein ACH47Z_37215 [Streptomyces sp. NPDC020192]|uniref:hypothetical protein n=1 Tax=Streptomyces sp. NPDC020192 TaxID=3365066 RepID=UPI00378FADA6